MSQETDSATMPLQSHQETPGTRHRRPRQAPPALHSNTHGAGCSATHDGTGTGARWRSIRFPHGVRAPRRQSVVHSGQRRHRAGGSIRIDLPPGESPSPIGQSPRHEVALMRNVLSFANVDPRAACHLGQGHRSCTHIQLNDGNVQLPGEKELTYRLQAHKDWDCAGLPSERATTISVLLDRHNTTGNLERRDQGQLWDK